MFFKMRKNKFHVVLHIITLLFIVLLFCYFRIKPIYYQTVGYTYDQGRDFLKVAEMVIYHNPTFIGPTTGIMGVFHGAWWYYLLSIPFFLTGGNPIGFYFFNFCMQLVSLVAFIFFSKKYFGFLTTSILSFLITTSSFSVFNSIFAVNNALALPAFLFLLMTFVMYFEGQHKITFLKSIQIPMLLLVGLFLGFVAEFEFAFGLLLIPTFLILSGIYLFKKILKINLKEYAFFFTGLVIPFVPRILFEVKNGFSQTKTLLSFVHNPQYFTPKTYDQIFFDRVAIFNSYFESIFMSDWVKIIIILCLIICVIYRFYVKDFIFKKSLVFLIILGLALFIISTFYKDTFWSYYYEGIQYLFILIFGYILTFKKRKDHIILIIKSITLAALLILGLGKLISEFRQQPIYDGIQVQNDIVEYIQSHSETNQENYCVKVYTPPVIPYTYNYLFLYNKISQNIPEPSDSWAENSTCWLIVEYDENNERKQLWIDNTIPLDAGKIVEHQIKDVDIYYYSNTKK